MLRRLLILSLVVLMPSVSFAQKKAKQPKERPDPTYADFVYGQDSPRQKFDFWQAPSDMPTPLVLLIHGGGWKGGDKTGYGTKDIRPYLDAGISVASINYRFIDQAMEQKVEPPVKACLHDAARALQTLRSKAKEWNIDPTRVGATGGSAGACTSLWLALHDDLADPKSADPIARIEPLDLRGGAGRRHRSIPRSCANGFPTRSMAATPSVFPARARARRRVRAAIGKSRPGDAVDQGVLADRTGEQG